MTIEQSDEQIKASINFTRNANLELIRLVSLSFNFRSNAGQPDLGSALEFAITYQPAQSRVSEGAVRFDIDFACLIGKRKEQRVSDKPNVECEMRFEATYRLRSGYNPTPEEISSFHAANAIFNCWPFFRECTQNTIVRASLPPPPIPFLRLAAKPPTSDTSTLAKKSAIRSGRKKIE